MSFPVTALVNPALRDNESLLFYATQNRQLALQRWSFQPSVQTTDFHENGLWQGPIVLPSALASFVQRGLSNVYGFIKAPGAKNEDPMIIAQLSPVTQLLTTGDELTTSFSGLAATGDGNENVYVYYLKNSGPGTSAAIQQCSLGNNEPEFNPFDNPTPASTSRIAAVHVGDGTRLIFFQKSNNDIQFINSSETNPDAHTIHDTGSAAPSTPLTAIVYTEGGVPSVYLYFVSGQKKIMRATANVSNLDSIVWSTPATRDKLKLVSADSQLCATVSAKENMVFYVESGAKDYNIHRDPRT
ncbi:uncharacterized protein KY384_001266 [Bacidia gigantensis]|uniref:uncharacterized protein n=1 Tax=Bacidia gigantensis TaxID=2732470 RepID=UPI001D0413A5|nr:uncharacterized protein KY384_001266 [Bacidia gigantensis]KAG8533526.1 hypothetical protein KY384_001266 [Bacidia gigantensis]